MRRIWFLYMITDVNVPIFAILSLSIEMYSSNTQKPQSGDIGGMYFVPYDVYVQYYTFYRYYFTIYHIHTRQMCIHPARSYYNENSILLEKGWFLTRIKGKNVHYFSDHDKEFIQFSSLFFFWKDMILKSVLLSRTCVYGYMGIN